MPTALVTGITGQDGWYLGDLLVARGYAVVGVARRESEVPQGVTLQLVDARDGDAMLGVLRAHQPDEVYHLAADSSVVKSWENAEAATQAVVEGTRVVLDACAKAAPSARLVVASSCEVFGGQVTSPQHEDLELRPVSPYGKGKALSLELIRERRRQGAHVSAAILYNHESPRRPPEFLSRKVTRGAALIAAGRETSLRLGSLEARRDWGFAGDYAQAMWRMSQQPEGDDFVIGTGVAHSVAELCAVAFAAVGLDYRHHVESDPAFVRAVDPVSLVANREKARRVLDWTPVTSFETMITAMVQADVARLSSSEG